jgi:hypothetical protein
MVAIKINLSICVLQTHTLVGFLTLQPYICYARGFTARNMTAKRHGFETQDSLSLFPFNYLIILVNAVRHDASGVVFVVAVMTCSWKILTLEMLMLPASHGKA